MTSHEDADPGRIGRSLGPYRLLEHIGGGGMGLVYRAEDTRLGRTVAVKLLAPELTRDPRAKARFLQEARLASALDHPNICSIYEAGETEDLQLYLVMPCYEGETLRDRIERGPLPLPDVLDVARQIALGLAHAHRYGIVHRDVKPANVFLLADGLVKILDFGVAKLAGGDGFTQTGTVVGTTAYMAPEQMRGDEVDARADLWSLGILIYQMTAGRRPFRGEPESAVRAAILDAAPEPLSQVRPEVPPDLARLVAGLLEKDPAARPVSAEAVAGALRHLAGGGAGTGTGSPGLPVPVEPGRRWPRRALLAGLAALLVLAVALGIARWRGGMAPPSPPAPSAGAPRAPVVKRLSVLILGFRDLSGEAATRSWLGPALTEMLTTELAAGAAVRVVEREHAALARSSLEPAAAARLDRVSLERLHSLAGADLAVVGAFLPLEDQGTLRLDIRVVTLPEGDTVASLAESGPESELFQLVARMGERLRRSLGLSLPTEEQSREARRLLPAGSDAIRLYTEARMHLRAYEPGQARDLLLAAAKEDPASPVIRAALSEAWALLGRDAQARAAALEAFELRHSLPQEAQLVIEAGLYRTERQWARAGEVYRSLWTFFPDETEYGLQLASALMMEGRGAEGIKVLEELRQRPTPEGDDPRIDLIAAQTARRIADLPLQDRASAAAIAKARRLGANLLLARALVFRADALLRTGRAGESVAFSRQAEALASREGDRWLTGMALSNLGMALRDLGAWREAEQVYERSMVIARDLGTEMGIGAQYYCLGELSRDRGDLAAARRFLEQADASTQRIADQMTRGQVASAIAPVYLATGDPDRAEALFTEALAAARLVRNRGDEVRALHGLAGLRDLRGDLAAARRLQEEALQILRGLDQPTLAASVLASSADLLRRTGDLPLARRRLDQAVAAGRKSGNALLSGQLQELRARFACGAGDVAGCRSASRAALALARRIGARPLEAVALRQEARAEAISGDRQAARSLLEQSLRLSTEMGDQLSAAAARADLARLDESGPFQPGE